MRRRDFIAFLGAATVTRPLAAAPQSSKVYRVALVFAISPVAEMAGPEPVDPVARAFLHALGAFGYVGGRNLILERRSAEGQFLRYDDIIAELDVMSVPQRALPSVGADARRPPLTNS